MSMLDFWKTLVKIAQCKNVQRNMNNWNFNFMIAFIFFYFLFSGDECLYAVVAYETQAYDMSAILCLPKVAEELFL